MADDTAFLIACLYCVFLADLLWLLFLLRFMWASIHQLAVDGSPTLFGWLRPCLVLIFLTK